MDNILIQHRFTIERDGHTLQDAIVLPKEDYEKLTPEEIEVQKEERFTNWVKVLTTPPPVLSKEEELAQVEEQLKGIEEQKISIEQQKIQLTAQKVELASVIAEAPIKEVIKGGK